MLSHQLAHPVWPPPCYSCRVSQESHCRQSTHSWWSLLGGWHTLQGHRTWTWSSWRQPWGIPGWPPQRWGRPAPPCAGAWLCLLASLRGSPLAPTTHTHTHTHTHHMMGSGLNKHGQVQKKLHVTIMKWEGLRLLGVRSPWYHPICVWLIKHRAWGLSVTQKVKLAPVLLIFILYFTTVLHMAYVYAYIFYGFSPIELLNRYNVMVNRKGILSQNLFSSLWQPVTVYTWDGCSSS